MTVTLNLRKTAPFFLLTAMALSGCGSSSGGGGSTSNVNPSELANPVCAASLAPSSYFEEVNTASSVESSEEAAYVRSRTVKVDIEALKQMLMASSGKTIKLDMFSDKVLEVQVEKVESPKKGNVIVTGHTSAEGSAVTLVINDQVLVGNVHPADGYRYNIRSIGNGLHSIQEFDDTENSAQAVGDGDCLAIPDPDGGMKTPAAGVDTATAGTPMIDMLVAYTPSALSKAGSNSAMMALIQMGIADTNKAFANSGVNLAVRLVGTLALKQNETGDFSSDLTALKGSSDGRWDEVHAARAQTGADQVTVVGVYPNNSVAGIGYIGAGYSSAFTVVKSGAFGQYTFSHELGHNVGLQHSDGLVNSSGGFRTIMAYGSVPRILRYSNPGLSYSGYNTGDSSHNSAKILNAYGYVTAGLVAPKTPVTSDQIPPSLSPCP